MWVMSILALLPLWWFGDILRPRAASPTTAPLPPATRTRTERILLGVMIACITLCAVLVGNRTIWIGVGAMLGIGCLLAMRRRDPIIALNWRYLLIAIAALIALLVVSAYLRFKGAGGTSPFSLATITQDNRWLIWGASWNLIQVHPWLGYGLGREGIAPLLIAQFSEPLQRALFTQAHNVFLNAQLQMGIGGLVTTGFMFAALLWRFVTLLRGNRHLWLIGSCGLMLVLGTLLRNQMDDFFIRQSAILFFILVGVLLGRAAREAASEHLQSAANVVVPL